MRQGPRRPRFAMCKNNIFRNRSSNVLTWLTLGLLQSLIASSDPDNSAVTSTYAQLNQLPSAACNVAYAPWCFLIVPSGNDHNVDPYMQF